MSNSESDNDKLAATAKALFDDSVDRLDGEALSKLNQARHRALDELKDTGSKQLWLRWVPASGVAAVALVTVMIVQGPAGPEAVPQPGMASDFELLLHTDDLEMLEDLEFYSWLEASDLESIGEIG